ncbi:hypothetical protein Myrod_0776 [Myroides odoratus DSM 2801]|nr:hypothetical protein Myrod_0776 [Myroides odoratus DSM 2801]
MTFNFIQVTFDLSIITIKDLSHTQIINHLRRFFANNKVLLHLLLTYKTITTKLGNDEHCLTAITHNERLHYERLSMN